MTNWAGMIFKKKVRFKSKENICMVKNQSCVACYTDGPSDAHHIKSKGSGGGDELWNLMALCRTCHTEVHKIGLRGFAAKFGGARGFLKSYGWTYDEIFNQWRRP